MTREQSRLGRRQSSTSRRASPASETTVRGGDADAGFTLWREAMRWQRAVNAALGPVQLTHTQFLALASLDRAEREAGEAVSQRAVAREAGLDEGTLSSVFRTLEDRGLIDRGPTFGDGRAWRVILSSSGQRLLRTAIPLVDTASQRFFADQPSGR